MIRIELKSGVFTLQKQTQKKNKNLKLRKEKRIWGRDRCLWQLLCKSKVKTNNCFYPVKGSAALQHPMQTQLNKKQLAARKFHRAFDFLQFTSAVSRLSALRSVRIVSESLNNSTWKPGFSLTCHYPAVRCDGHQKAAFLSFILVFFLLQRPAKIALQQGP